jgi:hypothetical protein
MWYGWPDYPYLGNRTFANVSIRTIFTLHAKTVMDERRIDPDWVRRAIETPDWIEADPTQAGAIRAFVRLPEYDNRVCRVVYVEEGDERRVITTFVDRGRRHGPKEQ